MLLLPLSVELLPFTDTITPDISSNFKKIQIALPPKTLEDAPFPIIPEKEPPHIQLTIQFQTGDKMKTSNLLLLSLNKPNKLKESHGFQELDQLQSTEDISFQTSVLITMLSTALNLLLPPRLPLARNSLSQRAQDQRDPP